MGTIRCIGGARLSLAHCNSIHIHIINTLARRRAAKLSSLEGIWDVIIRHSNTDCVHRCRLVAAHLHAESMVWPWADRRRSGRLRPIRSYIWSIRSCPVSQSVSTVNSMFSSFVHPHLSGYPPLSTRQHSFGCVMWSQLYPVTFLLY